MRSRTSRWCALIAAFALVSASAALAADPEAAPPSAPTAETRDQMAAVHQKMAECLRSERPLAECRAEMMKSCHDMKGEGACPRRGPRGGMGPGMMGEEMMKAPESPATAAPKQ